MASRLETNKSVQILNDKLVVRVNTLDNSQKVILVDPTTTVESVTTTIVEKLEIPSQFAPLFSLHECKDGVTIERYLPLKDTVLSVMEKWPEDGSARLVLQVRLFTQPLLASTHAKVIYMMYIQCVYNVIAGLYTFEEDEALHLGALQMSAKFGPHDPERHKTGFLSKVLVEYIPGTMMAAHTPEEWEELMYKAHAGLEIEDPRAEYVEVCKKLPYFGCTFFGVKQSFDKALPKQLLLGVNRNGILLLKPADGGATKLMETLAEHSLNDIHRWAYRPKEHFEFVVRPEEEEDENPSYRFATKEGNIIAELLTDYAMALLKEMGLNPDGSRIEETKTGDDASAAASPAAAAAPAVAKTSSLPADWIEVADEASGRNYFYNNRTGESRWDRPTE